jgi:beta-lactamase regulating signal transducer with metallopeptidase domain
MMTAMGLAALSGVGILSAARLAMWVLGKTSASLRHLVWTAALAALVVVPALQASGLRFEVQVPPGLLKSVGNWGAGDGFTNPPAGFERLVSEAPASRAAVPSSEVSQPMSGSSALARDHGANVGWLSKTSALVSRHSTRDAGRTARGLLVGGWLAGCLLLLGLTTFSHLAARSLTVRDVQRPSSLARRRLAMLCAQLGIRQRVRLLVSPRIRVPATWGLMRSTVMLPADHASWSGETLDRALLHELAHVRRRDCWSYLLGQLARALHWPNPLVWAALHHQRLESERACDDHVLNQGAPASAYAEDLVAMARALRAEAALPHAALGMAGHWGISRRVRAILDPTQARSRVGSRTILIAGASTIGLAAAIAVVTPVAVAQDMRVRQPRANVEPTQQTEPVEASWPAGARMDSRVAPEETTERLSPTDPVTGLRVVVSTSVPTQSKRDGVKLGDESFQVSFQVLQSEHFDWYFDPAEAEAVGDAIQIAELWYERLADFFQHEFEQRKPVILGADYADLPRANRIIVPLTDPYGATDRILGHELVHAFQYDIAQSSPGGFQGLSSLPLWLIEGMAEYLSVGRDDPLTAMQIREAIRGDDFPTIRQMTRESRFSFRFGQAFWAYIGDTYGDDAIMEVFRSSLRTRFEDAVQEVIGLDVETLSARWRAEIAEEYLR